jgi:hypothetical protein
VPDESVESDHQAHLKRVRRRVVQAASLTDNLGDCNNSVLNYSEFAQIRSSESNQRIIS